MKNMIRKHRCKKCHYVYEFDINRPNNSYVDYEDSNHYDCPICGNPYYPPFQDLNIIGNIIRNIL